MKHNSKKELTPVFYGDFPVKLLHRINSPADTVPFTLHWHERIELHRILEGSLELFCGDEQITLKKGDISIISPTLLHSGRAGKDGVLYNVLMFDLAELATNNTAVCDHLKPLYDGKIIFDRITQNAEILEQVDRITDLCINRKSCHQMEIIGNLYNLIGLLYRHCNPQKSPHSQTEEGFDSIINYINNHFTEDISTSTLSRIFGYDQAYLCRKFKSSTGMSVMKYLQILRLEKARKQLLETASTVKHIASACGYSDTAYFTSRFKEMYGVTPTKLRKENRK